ncbi:MAG TPA: class I adenylate-forming enzyme family protein [Acidimicrobiales bacterium]
MTFAELRERAYAELTGPGAPFEICEEVVLGERVAVFKNRHRSLRELLLHASERHGDAGYLTIDGTTLAYREHLAAVGSVARALAERYGIGKGDRVAVLAANCPEWAITFWAATSLGAIVCAFNGWWTADEIRYGLELSEPSLLVGDARRLARLRGLDVTVPVVEIESQFAELLDHAPGAPLPEQRVDEDDPALILFTSGTTGRPKGALVSHRGLVGFAHVNLCNAAIRARINALANPDAPPAAPAGQNVTLLTAPMFHVSGLLAGVILGLATGSRLVLRRGRFDPEDVLRLIQEERVTSWSPIGGTGPRVIDHPSFEKYDVSSVRSIGFGGGPTSPSLRARMKEAFPNAAASLANGYGSSETVASVTSNVGVEYEQFPTSCGRPNPTCEVAIFDELGKPVPDGVEGEIHVRSAYNMLGYWRDDEATKAVFKPGRWLATGDIGRMEDGRLFINSRARDMIIRSGENIYPIEIEQRLDAHPLVHESAVVGVDHPVHGQEVKAIVVAASPDVAIDTEELARFVGETLAPYKVPTVWEIRCEPLPRNASGKVLKTVLLGETEAPQEH